MSCQELAYPRKVQINDITVRDGFQHEEIWIPTDAKLFYLEELILCGIKHLEVTNLGNPLLMPQFKDADELFKRLRDSKKLSRAGINWNDITLTAITIRERAVDRAIMGKKEGWGPDRILMMVSTDEEHHFANSGTTLPNYWAEAKRCIEKAKDVGIKLNGTVSTIWGSPISGPTRLEEAVEFTKRWLEIGAADIRTCRPRRKCSPGSSLQILLDGPRPNPRQEASYRPFSCDSRLGNGQLPRGNVGGN